MCTCETQPQAESFEEEEEELVFSVGYCSNPVRHGESSHEGVAFS